MNFLEPGSHTLAKKTAYLFDTDFKVLYNVDGNSYTIVPAKTENVAIFEFTRQDIRGSWE